MVINVMGNNKSGKWLESVLVDGIQLKTRMLRKTTLRMCYFCKDEIKVRKNPSVFLVNSIPGNGNGICKKS